ncbi:hypothetical protein [Aquitalea pelogenes]|uniref:hypothetical protein n=1 Tax=Aquitalea pelogenes TaxID=1293573 RepID=UPI0007874CA5|nr:hypothetical protein [Aquitalea pelogenes]
MTLLRILFVLLTLGLLSTLSRATELHVPVAEPAAAPSLSYSLENLFYTSGSTVRHDGFYNPDNRLINYPRQWSVADMRGKWRVDDGQQALLLQPRLRWQERVFEHDTAAYPGSAANYDAMDIKLDQAFWRWSGGESTFLLGREVFTWGPATFRSPSSPVYFDAGKTDPLSLLSGLDMLRYSYAMDALTATLAYVYASSAVEDTLNYQNMSQLKLDYQTTDSLLSINLAKQFATASNISFVGGFMQRSVGDAWLVYAEAGRMSRPQGEMSSQLLGLSYTFMGGQVLTAEYLHGHSDWGRMNGRQILDRRAKAGLAMTATDDAGLWGRNYLWLGLNSNVQDSNQFWRLELTRNLDDHSVNIAAYYEKSLNRYLSGFVHASRSLGGSTQEFGWLLRSSFTLGLKWFVF